MDSHLVKRARTRAVSNHTDTTEPLVGSDTTHHKSEQLTYSVGSGTDPTCIFYSSHFEQIELLDHFQKSVLFSLASFWKEYS